MGQRLGINLIVGGKTICNTYYHWSAYTQSSIELTELLLSSLEETKHLQIDPKIRAYMAFRKTGAHLSSEEHQYIQDFNGSAHFNVLKQSTFEYVPEKVNRSDGLIAFSPDGMSDTESWAEGEVDLNMENSTFSFNVFHSEDDDHEGRSALVDSYAMEDGDIDRIPVLHGEINFNDLKQEDIPFLQEIIETACRNEYGLVRLPDLRIYFGAIQ